MVHHLYIEKHLLKNLFNAGEGMNINLQDLINQNPMNYNKLIEAILNTNSELSSDIKGNLIAGQTFSGKIIDINQQDIQIQLADNQILQAKIADNFDFNIGDNITFEIKESTPSRIIISPVSVTLQASDALVQKALSNANLQNNDKNVQIVKSLIAQNMPVDKETIRNILKAANAFPESNIDHLVFMQKNDIPINEQTIKQFDDYLSGNHQIVKDINTISEKLYNILEKLIKSDNIRGALEFNDKVNQVFYEGTEPVQNNNVEIAAQLKQENMISNLAELKDTLNITIPQKEELKALITNLIKNLPEGSEAAPIYEQLKRALDDGEHPVDLMKTMNELMKNPVFSDTANFSALKDIFGSKEFKILFKEQITDRLTIDPNSFKNEIEKTDYIVNTYHKIEKAIDKLANIFSQYDTDNAGGLNTCQNVSNNLNFMQSLSHITPYVQIPLKLHDNNGNADLYVYKRSNGKQNNNDNITAFLHLDLENLGATDIHIQMHGKNVRTEFTLQDEDSMHLVEKYLSILQERLEAKGYHTEYTVSSRTTDNYNVIDKLTEDVEPRISVKRYTFDVRA